MSKHLHHSKNKIEVRFRQEKYLLSICFVLNFILVDQLRLSSAAPVLTAVLVACLTVTVQGQAT